MILGGLEGGMFSQRQWMGSRWTRPALSRVLPIGKLHARASPDSV